jgi:VIT1/CCC1 family predicted Fe2+/Mn2+ transporter
VLGTFRFRPEAVGSIGEADLVFGRRSPEGASSRPSHAAAAGPGRPARSSRLRSRWPRRLTAHDAFGAHVEIELGLDPHELTNPWQAAASSAVSFTLGALLPLLAILLPPTPARIPITVMVVLIALSITGWISARIGGGDARRAALRATVGGAFAMAITFGIGHLVGHSVT